MLEPICNDSKREDFDTSQRFWVSLAVRQNPGQLDDLSHPATILFLLEFHPHRLGVHAVRLASIRSTSSVTNVLAGAGCPPGPSAAPSRRLGPNHNLNRRRVDLKGAGELLLCFGQQRANINPSRSVSTRRYPLERGLTRVDPEFIQGRVVNGVSKPVPCFALTRKFCVFANVNAIPLLSVLGAHIRRPRTSPRELGRDRCPRHPGCCIVFAAPTAAW